MDLPDLPDLPDLQDTMVLRVALDLPDLPDLQDFPDLQDIMVLRAPPDHLENLVFRALVEHPGTMVPKDHLDPGPVPVISRLYPVLE